MPRCHLAGKSNLMDAISFVLGVKARDLRGSQLKVRMRGLQMPPTQTDTITPSPPGEWGGVAKACACLSDSLMSECNSTLLITTPLFFNHVLLSPPGFNLQRCPWQEGQRHRHL